MLSFVLNVALHMNRFLVGKLEGKRPLEGHRHRWEYNIKMDLQEVGWGACTGLIWLGIATGGRLL